MRVVERVKCAARYYNSRTQQRFIEIHQCGQADAELGKVASPITVINLHSTSFSFWKPPPNTLKITFSVVTKYEISIIYPNCTPSQHASKTKNSSFLAPPHPSHCHHPPHLSPLTFIPILHRPKNKRQSPPFQEYIHTHAEQVYPPPSHHTYCKTCAHSLLCKDHIDLQVHMLYIQPPV